MINLFAQTARRWFSTLNLFSQHKHRAQKDKKDDFLIKLIIKLMMASPLLFTKILYKKPWMMLPELTELTHIH
jgi:hypothetical protein